MPGLGTPASYLLRHPVAFAIRVLRSFRANQGYLLAGAVAYNTLLSILRLLILILIALANFVEQSALLATLGRYLEWIVPGQSLAIMGELALFLGIGALIVTFVSGALQAISRESVEILGRTWSLVGVSGFLLYLIGVVGEIIVLTSIYMVMPAGHPSWRHALIGGVIAGLLGAQVIAEYERLGGGDAQDAPEPLRTD